MKLLFAIPNLKSEYKKKGKSEIFEKKEKRERREREREREKWERERKKKNKEMGLGRLEHCTGQKKHIARTTALR
jgi:hypothetical protein